MKTNRRFSLGWGAAAFLLTVSIGAGVRLASIGVDALEIIADAPAPTTAEATGVVAVIEPATVDDLANAFRPAIQTARDQSAYSFVTFSPCLPPFLPESAAMTETLDMARAAEVDAILVRADRTESLDRAAGIAADGIITAAVGSLLPTSSVHIRVGVDPVQLADRASALIGTTPGNTVRVGYLCGLCSGADSSAAMRMVNRLQERLQPAEIVVQRVDDAELGSIAAAQSVLGREVDVIFCDTAEATVAAAQVVINANRVGGVRIVGFGDSERVQALVDDRVVEASVTADYASAVEQAFRVIDRVVTGAVAASSFSVDRPVDLVAALRVLDGGGDP